MNKRKLAVIALLFSVLLLQIACKSYTIPYDQNLNGKIISTGLYVCETGTPSAQFSGPALQLIGKAAIHSSSIIKAYTNAKLRDIFYEELQKNGGSISPKMKIIIQNASEREIIIPEIANIARSEPKKSEFDFQGIPEKIGKDYIFIIKVLDYGFVEGSFSISSKIDYVASIIDMKNNVKVWQEKGSKESRYPFMSGFSEAKDTVKVESNLRDCVIGIIQDISAYINNNTKN